MVNNDNWLESVANQLANQNFAITDHFLSLKEVIAIKEVFKHHQSQETFKRAGVGKEDDFMLDREIRGDYIKWIDPDFAMQPVRFFLSKINQLQDYLNKTCFLGIRDYEAHFTIYPPGSFYKRHLDQFQGDGARKISFICYLNNEWQQGDGGELRLYLNEEEKDIQPLAGKLVCLRSEIIEHEVLLAHKHRYSLTGWMLNHPIGLEFIKNQ